LLKGKEQLTELFAAVRKQLVSSADREEWGTSIEPLLKTPDDGSDSALWSALEELLKKYVSFGEEKFLWEAVARLARLSDWYLSRPVTIISGVGKKRAEKLANLGIETVADLLHHYPRAYTDRRYVDQIADVDEVKYYTLYGEVLSVQVVRGRNPRLEVRLGDDSGSIRVNFWNQTYLADKFTRGTKLFCFGRADFYRGRPQLNNPEFEIIGSPEKLDESRSIMPVYPLSEGLSQRRLRSWLARALDFGRPLLTDSLPADLRRENELPPRPWSIRNLHEPETVVALEQARKRLIFEEFFYFQLIFALHNWNVETISKGREYTAAEQRDRFVDSLPFELTGDQHQVLAEIESDLCDSAPVHRLLQGDVGTGKTVVALAAILRVIDSGYQAALMAPTEVLAEQHYRTASELLNGIKCSYERLTGSLSAPKKETVRHRLNSGELDLVIGTHALIQEGVDFSRLGFIVVDEQHRFGVDQRRRLREKGPSVDMLIMSATPIPRSLAMTAYGDLEVSTLEEFPLQRRRVQTRVLDRTAPNRRQVYEHVRQLAREDCRSFFIFPAIEKNESTELTAAEDAFQRAQSSELFAGLGLGLLHGRLDSEEKKSVMDRFRRGEIQVLFSTTVVEVGVDVPEASCLVVFEAERFGLAQLHQLRGRIGRAGQQAYCYLFLNQAVAPGSRERLQVLERTDDGFQVARRDLQFRGIGSPTGTEQSGWGEFEIGNVWEDREIMSAARSAAEKLVASTNGLDAPRLALLNQKLHSTYADQLQFARIG